MSRESLGVAAPGVDDDPDDALPDALPEDTPLAAWTEIDTEPAPSEQQQPTDDESPTAARARRPSRRVALVAAAVTAAVVGALGGATSAHQQDRQVLDAAARVVLALDVDQGPPVDSTTPQGGDVLVMATVSLTGSVGDGGDVLVRSVRTPIGSFDLYPALHVRDGGAPWRTLLKQRVDCAVVERRRNSDVIDGRLLAGSVAVVRPAGSGHDVEVPVLVSNPSMELTAISDRCRPPDPVDLQGGYEVGAMVGYVDGSVRFVVAPSAGRRADLPTPQFTFVRFLANAPDDPDPYAVLRPARQTATTSTFTVPDTTWSVTATPRLPLAVDGPTLVTLTFSYFCPRGSRRVASPTVPHFPDDVTVGSVDAFNHVTGGPVGWDDAAFRAAATAAAVTACARPPAS